MKKHLLIAGILCLALSSADAQTMFSASKGAEKYEIPLNATITVSENGVFSFSLDGKDYELPAGTEIGLSEGETYLPVTVRGLEWKPGVSSLQSGSNGIFSSGKSKFSWTGDDIAFSDYDISGTVVDTVKNVRLDASCNTRMYGDVVDLVFYKVATGETGMYSLPSDTYCAWKESTHVGKYGVLVLSYGIDSRTGARLNNGAGVAKWFSQLDVYTGVSGRKYSASGTVEYFDDLATAKDITLNTKNFSRSIIGGQETGSLSAPTWNYLSEGETLSSANYLAGSELAANRIGYRALVGLRKPTADELEKKYACRFDSPDENSVIADYFFTAADPDAAFQYPELKSAPGLADDPYKISECNVWKGGTCMYLVPSNGTTFSKYRKFDGYIHARMVDGAEYSRHITINKSGEITDGGSWTKDKEPTISVTKADCYEDNGNIQYFGLKLQANILSGSSNGLDKNVADYAEAHAVETDLDAKGTLAFIPKANAYVPYRLAGIKPEKKVHYCNYSFVPEDDKCLGAEFGTNGIALTIGDGIDSPYYEKAYKYWIFTDCKNRMICYTLSDCGGISHIEWFE